MGVSNYVGFDRFPVQGTYKGVRVKVCFHYETNRGICGTVIRDDAEGDHRTIIQLDDGRVVLGTECQYTLVTSK